MNTHVTLTWGNAGEHSREYKIRRPLLGNTERAIEIFNLPTEQAVFDCVDEKGNLDNVKLTKKIIGSRCTAAELKEGFEFLFEGTPEGIDFETLDLVGVRSALINFTSQLFTKSCEALSLSNVSQKNAPHSSTTTRSKKSIKA